MIEIINISVLIGGLVAVLAISTNKYLAEMLGMNLVMVTFAIIDQLIISLYLYIDRHRRSRSRQYRRLLDACLMVLCQRSRK